MKGNSQNGLYKSCFRFPSYVYINIYKASYRDYATGWMTRVWFLAAALMDFSLCHHIQTGSVAHPASYPVCKRISFLGGRMAGIGDNHLPLSRAEVINAWN